MVIETSLLSLGAKDLTRREFRSVRGAQRATGIEQGVHILRHTFCSAFAAASLRRDKSRRSNSEDPWLRRTPTTSKSERAQRVSPRDAPSLLRSYGAQDGAGLWAPPLDKARGVLSTVDGRERRRKGTGLDTLSAGEVANERKRVSHRSGAGIEGVPASDCVRGLGTKVPRSRLNSGLRGSNPSSWLGKPEHYHYAKPASG